MILIYIHFQKLPNCNNWEVSSSYKLQLPSAAALSIPISPTPKSMRPGGSRGARWFRRQPGHHSFILSHSDTSRQSVALYSAVDR